MKSTIFTMACALLALYSCNSEQVDTTPEVPSTDTLAVDTVAQAAETTPLLGEAVNIMIGTKNYEETIQFYQTLGWHVEDSSSTPWKWSAMYDGSMSLTINEDTMNYMGPAYHSEDAVNVYKTLKAINVSPQMELKRENGDAWFNVYFAPDSLGFVVINEPKAPKKDIQVADIVFNPTKKFDFPNPKAGIFQEYALAVENVDSSLVYYTALGFESQGIHEEGVPYRYTIGYDGQLTLGLHETKGMWHGELFTYSGHGINENDSLAAEMRANNYAVEALEFGGQVLPGNYMFTDPAGNIFFLTTDFSGMKK
ncbi:hypothetical protein [Lishizhenia sp.]|uniref:hypothetical protein n=1 Tax=Lishizhenia sp. TaxID=2497594 RepID=UPI00299F02B5|nr:hypothetical protein [Lishizhenia sp.]MDX1445812.1 hypothetical protein [Lishizhenia sp.]